MRIFWGARAVSSVFCFGLLLSFFWTYFSFFFWGLELGCGVFGGVFFGVVLLLLLCGAFRFIVILRHRGSYSSCAQVSPCPSLFCAYTYLPHHSAHRTIPLSPFIPPILLGSPLSFSLTGLSRIHFLTLPSHSVHCFLLRSSIRICISFAFLLSS